MMLGLGGLLRRASQVARLPSSRFMGKTRSPIKKRYLRKFPLVRTAEDGTVTVEGVSNKSMPCPIPWKEPSHVERVTPGEDGSGDLGNLASLVHPDVIHPSRPQPMFEGSEAFMEAPEDVKRILSLEFGRNKHMVERIRNDVVRRVQEHKYDYSSPTVAVAQITVRIRNYQTQLAKLAERKPLPAKNQAMKHNLKICIDHRRVILDHIRKTDYKKFEWLLEELNIVYKPRPMEWEAIDRRVHQDRLCDLWCNELRAYRLLEYKNQLEGIQAEFLRQKAETLQWIRKEETELGLSTEISEEEVASLLKRAEELENARLEKAMDETEQHIFHIYEEKKEAD